MKKKNQTTKKLSLEKLQIAKITNLRTIAGGAVGDNTGQTGDTRTDPTHPGVSK